MPPGLTALELETDRALLQQIYDQYEPRMYRVALQVLKSSALAEDAVHDAFLKLIKHFSEIRKISCKELEPFVVIIVKRTALDLLKQEKRLTSLEDGWDPRAGSGPETETAYHRLVELIRSMPDTYREVLELRCVLEWSNKDIARRLSLSENAVAVRLMRGKALLQNKLEQEGYGREGFGI